MATRGEFKARLAAGAKGRPNPKTTADGNDLDAAEVARVKAALAQAVQRRADLRAEGATTVAGQRLVVMADQCVWELRADLAWVTGRYDAARKAAATANELGNRSIKLHRERALDQLDELEAKWASNDRAISAFEKI
jgi:hypothetical protein